MHRRKRHNITPWQDPPVDQRLTDGQFAVVVIVTCIIAIIVGFVIPLNIMLLIRH